MVCWFPLTSIDVKFFHQFIGHPQQKLWIIVAYAMSLLPGFALLFGVNDRSFLNVCIYRIPEGSFLNMRVRSAGTAAPPVPAQYNVPIFSYFLLRGRTACCQQPLSWQYPAVEFLTGLIFVVCYWRFPFLLSWANQSAEIDPANALRCLHAVIFSCLLLDCSVIDIRLMIIRM